MKNLRDYLNLIEDISQDSEPVVGDIVHIEMGDTLLETHITELLEDGVVIAVDETAMRMMLDAKKVITESRTKDQMHDDAERMTRSEFVKKYPDMGEFWDTVREDDLEDPESLGEDYEQRDAADAVASAITRRIMMRHADVLSQYGLDAVLEAIDDIAERYRGSELDEIGTSDVSSWVSEIMRNLEDAHGDKMDEAKYQGREVPLGKPMKGDVAKSKVYVRGPKGNVVKVNFGDKNMRIKKNIPGRRKSFRARHNCDNPGPRWKARYWSCRAW